MHFIFENIIFIGGDKQFDINFDDNKTLDEIFRLDENGEKFNKKSPAEKILSLGDNKHSIPSLLESLKKKKLSSSKLNLGELGPKGFVYPKELWITGNEVNNENMKIYHSDDSCTEINICKVDNQLPLTSQIKEREFDKIIMIRGLCSCNWNMGKQSCGGIQDPINFSNSKLQRVRAINQCQQFLQGVIDLMNLENLNSIAVLGGSIKIFPYQDNRFYQKALKAREEIYKENWIEAASRVKKANDKVEISIIGKSYDELEAIVIMPKVLPLPPVLPIMPKVLPLKVKVRSQSL